MAIRFAAAAEGWRYVAVSLLVAICLGAAGTAFWLEDWRYVLPTPRPADLEQPAIGTKPRLPEKLKKMIKANGEPVFLHFYNPDCPCSRFNQDHVLGLQKRFGGRIRFVAVLEEAQSTNTEIRMAAVHDEDKSIGSALGVYATPQAVILDASGKIYYRGNYNSSRYCKDTRTEYARIAAERLLAGQSPLPEVAEVATSYGCPLPRRGRGSNDRKAE